MYVVKISKIYDRLLFSPILLLLTWNHIICFVSLSYC